MSAAYVSPGYLSLRLTVAPINCRPMNCRRLNVARLSVARLSVTNPLYEFNKNITNSLNADIVLGNS